MRKIARILLGTIIAIIFSAIPSKSKAVSYSADKINTDAREKESYTIKTYFPGIGFQKMNVNFDVVKKESGTFRSSDGHYFPAIRATITMRCTIPKATQNKIKRNTVRIVKASKNRYNAQMPGAFVIDVVSGCTFNNENATGKVYSIKGKVHDKVEKTFKQKSKGLTCWYHINTGWIVDYSVIYNKKYEGNILVGVAGTAKDVSKQNYKVTSFTNGSAPVTSSAFFKNNKKDLSIWTKI